MGKPKRVDPWYYSPEFVQWREIIELRQMLEAFQRLYDHAQSAEEQEHLKTRIAWLKGQITRKSKKLY